MSRLHEIYNEIQKIKEMSISDFQKMERIHDLEKQASSETWSPDESYRLSAQSLHDYAQTQWSDIYSKTNKETQRKFEELLNNEVRDAKKWSIR